MRARQSLLSKCSAFPLRCLRRSISSNPGRCGGLDMQAEIAQRSYAVTFRSPVTESRLVANLLIGLAILFMGLFLLLPLAMVFAEAFAKGVSAYLASFADPDVLASIRLTLLVAAITVPLNTLFGVCAAWAV